MLILPIDKSNIPESIEISFGGDTYVITTMYNSTTDSFTVSLYRREESELLPIALGEKLMLGKVLWSDIPVEDLPGPDMIPLDLSDKESRITWDNFYKTVFIYIDDDIITIESEVANNDRD